MTDAGCGAASSPRLSAPCATASSEKRPTVRRCAWRPVRLHRIRRALAFAFTAAEARRRWPEVFRAEPPVSRKRPKSGVHCFNAAEVRALYLACQTDIERLLVTILFTTGMRIGSCCVARWTEDGGELTTNEKNKGVKRYPIARGLAALLPAWVAAGRCGKAYLFPNEAGGDRPLDPRRARAVFMDVAARAGLEGRHVKPRTVWHTVCWTLSALGNPLDDIADFVGLRHHSVAVAVMGRVYVAMDKAQKRGRTGAVRMRDIVLELAGAIAGPFASEDGRTFPDYRGPRPRVVDEERAKRKAQRKAKRREYMEQLKQQMAKNEALLRRLLQSEK